MCTRNVLNNNYFCQNLNRTIDTFPPHYGITQKKQGLKYGTIAITVY